MPLEFDKYGNLMVEPETETTRDVRRVVSEIRVTDVLSDNPLLAFAQQDELRVGGLQVSTSAAPTVFVYQRDITEDIPLGDGRTITADQFRFALTMIWAARATRQE